MTSLTYSDEARLRYLFDNLKKIAEDLIDMQQEYSLYEDRYIYCNKHIINKKLSYYIDIMENIKNSIDVCACNIQENIFNLVDNELPEPPDEIHIVVKENTTDEFDTGAE